MMKDDGGPWRYTPTIMDGPVVRCAFNSNFEVNASRNGVSVDGAAPIMGAERLKELQAMLGKALEAHEAIGRRGDHDAAKHWVEVQNAAARNSSTKETKP